MAENRFIDLDQTLQRLEKEIWWTESQKSAIRLFLYKSKVKDVVPVVRCKDCKMRCPESVCIAKHCTLTGIPVDDDDFCSYGERREGE